MWLKEKVNLINLNVTDLRIKPTSAIYLENFPLFLYSLLSAQCFLVPVFRKYYFSLRTPTCVCVLFYFLIFFFFFWLGFVIWNILLQSQNYTRRYIHRGLASVQALPLSHLFFLLHMVAFVRFILSFLFDRVN